MYDAHESKIIVSLLKKNKEHEADTLSPQMYWRSLSFIARHNSILFCPNLMRRALHASAVSMKPRGMASNSGKRKASPSPAEDSKANGAKKPKIISSASSDPLRTPHPSAEQAAENGIVLREFYPPEMNNGRCAAYKEDKLPKPIELLRNALRETRGDRGKIKGKKSVVHWFKCDLRTKDNNSLHLASEKAKSLGIPLIAIYIISPQDFQAHLTAPVRVDFILRTLEVLKADLGKLDIPLYVETVEKRKKIPGRMLELMKEWETSHLFANMEYEVDELRREADLVRIFLGEGIAMDVVEDTCVVAPGELSSGQGKQYAVYSPWFRSWVSHIHAHKSLLNLHEAPSKNPDGTRDKFPKLFQSEIPPAPENKKLSDEERTRFSAMWPAGEHEAQVRLQKFVQERIARYADKRNIPSENGTASVSVHFASGTLSARTAIRTARDANDAQALNAGKQGIQVWISEVAWRDFYKHVLAHWPYVCMNKPFKPEYTDIEWEYDHESFRAWCEGRTGYPIVDAAMRQLNHCGYMHNRCRMITASFLAKHLLIDWRMGERYFMEHLIDGDFASNNGGWGFSASTGVDPQPYFRIFNPLLQSEKFDAEGTYIRKWVEELRDVRGKAIHDPYERGEGKVCQKNGYPKRVVDHKVARERCLQRYKEGLGRATA